MVLNTLLDFSLAKILCQILMSDSECSIVRIVDFVFPVKFFETHTDAEKIELRHAASFIRELQNMDPSKVSGKEIRLRSHSWFSKSEYSFIEFYYVY